jgi:hypothetical protein
MTDTTARVGYCEGCKKDKLTLHLDGGVWRCHGCHALRALKRKWLDEMVVYF